MSRKRFILFVQVCQKWDVWCLNVANVLILCFCKISVNKYFCLSRFIISFRCSLSQERGVPCTCSHCSVWGPSGAAEPAAQPAGWRGAAVAIAMKSWLCQTSMRPVIFSHLLPQPQLSINSFISNQARLPVAGVQGAGGGAGLLGFHSQEGGQVQVQTCCSSSGPRSVLSTLRTGDPDLGRRNKLTHFPSWLSEVKPDRSHADDVISHLIIYDRVQSLQTRLAEGVSTVQAPWQPRHQVVATKAHDAHQVLSPQRCQGLRGNRGKRREGLTADVPLLFILLFLFFSAIWHVFLLDMTGRICINVNCDFHHFLPTLVILRYRRCRLKLNSRNIAAVRRPNAPAP